MAYFRDPSRSPHSSLIADPGNPVLCISRAIKWQQEDVKWRLLGGFVCGVVGRPVKHNLHPFNHIQSGGASPLFSGVFLMVQQEGSTWLVE